MSERTFRQTCDSCLRMRTTLPSLATRGGWRPFADWWMCPTCLDQRRPEGDPGLEAFLGPEPLVAWERDGGGEGY